MYKADCDQCGHLCTSVHEWVVNQVKTGHEERKEGHKVDISPITKIPA